MTAFASCYFCGTAQDAPVAAYPVADTADGDEPATVLLCPTCRQKLRDVLETAMPDAAAESLPIGEEPVSADGSSPAATDASEPDEQAAPGERTAAAPDEDDEPESTQRDADSGDESAAADDSTSDEPSVADSANGEEPDGTESPDEDEQAGGDDTPAPDDDGSDDAGPLATPTAKQVIRLLQNREFPVDREEFEVVASNAYDLTQPECADVIDALVAEGYVAESGGQLVRSGD